MRLAFLVTDAQGADHMVDMTIDARAASAIVEAIQIAKQMVMPGEILSSLLSPMQHAEASGITFHTVPPFSGAAADTVNSSAPTQEAAHGSLQN